MVYGPLQFLTDLAEEGRALLAARGGDPENFIEFSYEVKFTQMFFIGPGGLHGVHEHLDHVFRFVTEHLGLPDEGKRNAFSQLSQIVEDALWLLRHFRFKISRTLYDPTGGFRELAVAYKRTSAYLKVSNSSWCSCDHTVTSGALP